MAETRRQKALPDTRLENHRVALSQTLTVATQGTRKLGT